MTVTTAVEVANTEGTIITRLKEALERTTHDGQRICKRVTASTSSEQIEQTMFKTPTPYCGLLATMGNEGRGVPNRRDIVLNITLYVAHKVTSTMDETAKTIEKFRLSNLLKNVIESASEVNALATGIPDEDNFHRPGPLWGVMEDIAPDRAKAPWVAFKLPLTYGFPIANVTAH